MLEKKQIDKLEELFTKSDLIKFAKSLPTKSDINLDLITIRNFINSTEKNCSKVKSLRDYFQDKIKTLSPETIFFGEKANKVANTILMALPKIPGDLALMKLDLESFSVSSGSACSSGKVSKSHVVSAMGYDCLLYTSPSPRDS